jgi:hypothetical protein
MTTYPDRSCPTCGKPVALTRDGNYRRHFQRGADGLVHLCQASGQSGLTARELERPRARAL